MQMQINNVNTSVTIKTNGAFTWIASALTTVNITKLAPGRRRRYRLYKTDEKFNFSFI